MITVQSQCSIGFADGSLVWAENDVLHEDNKRVSAARAVMTEPIRISKLALTGLLVSGRG